MRPRLTYTRVIALTALLVALGGAAYVLTRTDLDSDEPNIVSGGEQGPRGAAAPNRNEAVSRPPGPAPACNGHAELCDKPLDQVAFPATHNSMAAEREPNWFAPNQRNGIAQQLDDGIRALLIDTHYGSPSSEGPVITDLGPEDVSRAELEALVGEVALAIAERVRDELAFDVDPADAAPYLCHVLCELGSTELTATLSDIRQFLDTHPDELVILFLQDVVKPKDAARAFEDSGLIRYAYAHESGASFPTMRELIENDERLLVLGEMRSGGPEFPWYHDGFELVQETPFAFSSAEEIAKAASCKPNRGTPDSPTFQINHWIEQVKPSSEQARAVNDFKTLLERVRLCERKRGLMTNILAVDFYDQGDVLGVANKLNGLDRSAAASVREIG